MAKYIAKRDTWLSHECRLVKEGQEFDTEFPKGMKLGSNIEPVKAKEDKKPSDAKPEPLV